MIHTLTHGPITYHLSGDNPQLLLISGTHGDEYEVISSTKKYVEMYKNRLPPFLFIPECSPSAVKLKTRTNDRGIDLNRSFDKNSSDPEVMAIKEIVSHFQFSLCVSFHEDPQTDQFYLYDSEKMESDKLNTLKVTIKQTGIGLYNVIDDPSDPVLGFKINDGYITLPLDQNEPSTLTFWGWGLRRGIFSHIYNPEIPGKISLNQKDDIVRILFDLLILPFYDHD